MSFDSSVGLGWHYMLLHFYGNMQLFGCDICVTSSLGFLVCGCSVLILRVFEGEVAGVVDHMLEE